MRYENYRMRRIINWMYNNELKKIQGKNYLKYLLWGVVIGEIIMGLFIWFFLF